MLAAALENLANTTGQHLLMQNLVVRRAGN